MREEEPMWYPFPGRLSEDEGGGLLMVTACLRT